MFKTATKIGITSLLRRRTRSALLILMIAVSLWGLLFIEGIYDGMTEQMIANAIRSDSGHISIFADGYRLNPDLSRWIENTIELDEFLNERQQIKSTVARLKQDGLVATAHYSRGIAILGIDLEREANHSHLEGYLRHGELNFGERQRGAIIGFKLAKKLKVAIGNKIILSAQNSAGEMASTALKVKGIIKTHNMAFDENAVFIAAAKARELLSMPTGISQIAISIANEGEIAPLQQQLQKEFPHLTIKRWDELYPALQQSRVLMAGFKQVINIIIFSIAALGIFGVMLVSVLERMREFGIMLAIGTKFSQIGIIILVEASILGCAGFGLGALAGVSTLYYFKIYGLDLSVFSSALDEFGLDAITYAIIRPDYFFTALAAIILASVFSIIIPLRILKKTKPVDAINAI